MRPRTQFLVAVALAMAGPTALKAQAFGVEMGVPVSKYGGKLVTPSPYYFQIAVPDPNPEFESYAALATPQTGICKVSALGRTHYSDSYGLETKGAFDKLVAALSAKYGKSQKFDYLQRGALWSKPNEWNWSIYKKERVVAAYWTLEIGSPLPPTIEGIKLDVRSVNPTDGAYVALAYEFANFDACEKIIDAAENSGL